jgi:hypothetical protein
LRTNLQIMACLILVDYPLHQVGQWVPLLFPIFKFPNIFYTTSTYLFINLLTKFHFLSNVIFFGFFNSNFTFTIISKILTKEQVKNVFKHTKNISSKFEFLLINQKSFSMWVWCKTTLKTNIQILYNVVNL